jgi:putative hemolysin
VTGGIITDIVLIGVLLLINAFLAAAEIALVSARRPRLRQLAEEGNRAAQTALNLAETPAFFLATIQIGITVAGFFTSAVGAVSPWAAWRRR